MQVPTYLGFWGKTGPEETWHPIAMHCMDVAACMKMTLEANESLNGKIASALRTTGADAIHVMTRIAAIHDLGKFAFGFQCKVRERLPSVLEGMWRKENPKGDHVSIGMAMCVDAKSPMKSMVKDFLRMDDVHAFRSVMSAAIGHHGRPPKQNRYSETEFGQAAMLAAIAFVQEMDAILPAPGTAPDPTEEGAKAISWLVSGAINLADWLGSDDSVFAYDAKTDPARYLWEKATPRAATVYERAGISRCQTATRIDASTISSGAIVEASPAQRYAETVDLVGGPQLHVIEDSTGSGKTEAAMILAGRLIVAGEADGFFLALPTMATANAMHARAEGFHGSLYATGERPSLVLAHGRRSLNERFARSRVRWRDGGDDGGSECASWIADDRRKTFLAHCGVGTIDQALMAALPTRYATLRQLGLSSKVLIVDEAHAYDEYMAQELLALVRFQMRNGGCCIVLSATLPNAIVTRMARAYAEGVGRSRERPVTSLDYPRALRIDSRGSTVRPLSARPGSERRVRVERTDPECCLATIVEAAKAGAACCYLRNSVDDATEAYAWLRERGFDPILFHSRFAMVDRLAIEAEVLRSFDKASKGEARRRILVATQVAEQSLDIDLDVMATDLAPIDLLIQRAGRLWRHARDGRPVGEAILRVASPDPTTVDDEAWHAAMFKRGSRVYPDAALLWRSAKALFEAGEIRSPDNVRALVEAVYGAGAPAAPEPIAAISERQENERARDRLDANTSVLDPEDGYATGVYWESDRLVSTRKVDPTTTVRLALFEGGRLRSYAPRADTGNWLDDDARAWALSEVTIRRYKGLGRTSLPRGATAQVEAIEARWRKGGDETEVVVLERSGEGFAGSLRSPRGSGNDFTYDQTGGLRFV